MTTLNKILFNIRNTIYGGVSSDDTDISDRQLIHWINIERNMLIKEEITKRKEIPTQVIQDLGCVPVECVDIIECCTDDYSTGEYIGRTSELPMPVGYHYTVQGTRDLFTHVSLINGSSLALTSELNALNARHRKFTAKNRYAFYKNKRLYITNPNGIELINVRGVFEDPTEASKFSSCTGEPCYTNDSPYPILPHHESIIVRGIIDKYIAPYLNPGLKDNTNDAKDR